MNGNGWKFCWLYVAMQATGHILLKLSPHCMIPGAGLLHSNYALPRLFNATLPHGMGKVR
jgi:hypothetical protein